MASLFAARLLAQLARRARALLSDPEALQRLVGEGETGSEAITGPLARVGDDLRALQRLIRAYATGRYRDISWESMALIVGAVLYVVSPLDIIPDWLPGAGMFDDLTVVSFALSRVRSELDRFLAWENDHGAPPEAPAGPDAGGG